MNNSYKLFIAAFILFSIFAGCIQVASAGWPFQEPQPVENVTTWTPVDKCWVYDTARTYGDMIFFVTYMDQNGHHELREVDIDTWYSITVNQGPFSYMYYQGGRA